MVASLQDQLQHTWARVMEQFVAEGKPLVRKIPSVEPADLQAAWTACHSSIRELLASHHGRSSVEDRFRVPEDYATFMQTNGGGWHCPHGLGWSLFDAATVARATAHDFESLVLGATEDEPVLDSGFWLGIGWFSDAHEYVLCCDRIHSYYGSVVDGHDSHPWLNGVEFGGCWRMAESFLAWLEMHTERA